MAANTTKLFKKVWSTIVGTIGSGSYATAGSSTIYLPMTTSRSFRNVQIRVTAHDVTAAGNCTLTTPVIEYDLGGIGWTASTLTSPNANSGENQTWTFATDNIASYFNTNFGSGASQSINVRFKATLTGTTPLLNNITVEIIGSVDCDDADNTKHNYLEFMCDSPTGALTATLTEIGTNQFPQLNQLGESSVTIRQAWLEFEGSSGGVGTANDAAFEVQIDANSAFTLGNVKTANASITDFKYIYDVTSLSLSTSAAHAIKLRTTNATTAATFPCVKVKVCVFYEFSWSASSSITNMLKVPFYMFDNKGLPSAQGAVAASLDFDIQDPATFTEMQSGVELMWLAKDATTMAVGVGAQSARTYTIVDGVFCGKAQLGQRIDSGGAQGAAATFARGRNRFAIFATIGSYTSCGQAAGWMTLVYKSGKSSIGSRAHTRCIPTCIFGTSAASGSGPFTGTAALFDFLDTDYAVVSQGFETIENSAALTNQALGLFAKSGSGELEGAYNYQIGTHTADGDGECMHLPDVYPVNKQRWMRSSLDPDTKRMNPKSSRLLTAAPAIVQGQVMVTSWICYHGHKNTFSRNANYTAGGTVNAYLVNIDTGEIADKTSRSGDGPYSLSCFDNVSHHIAYLRENDTHKTATGYLT